MIKIVDYGVGNIQAFMNLFKRIGVSVERAKNKNDFINASKLILPGVGHYDYAMKKLNNSGIRGILEECVLNSKIPILGVCLGHQIIGQVFGGKIIRAKNLMHGKTSKIKHQRMGLFKNIQNNFEATRYHSLVVDRKKFPKDLIITAETKNKTIMGLMHKDYNIHGFQFHPESISTKMGMKLIKNFITN